MNKDHSEKKKSNRKIIQWEEAITGNAGGRNTEKISEYPGMQ